MNRSESKYFKTACLMDEALISLLEEKDYEYITVKEICQKAGVNRSTFYLHYEGIHDLLAETLKYSDNLFMKQFSASSAPTVVAENIPSAPLDTLILTNERYLEPFLNFVRDNKSLYMAAYKNPACLKTDKQLEMISNQVIKPIMSRFNIQKSDQKYYISFYIHGCMAIVREWVNGGCEEEIEDIERVIIDCVRPNIEQGIKYER